METKNENNGYVYFKSDDDHFAEWQNFMPPMSTIFVENGMYKCRERSKVEAAISENSPEWHEVYYWDGCIGYIFKPTSMHKMRPEHYTFRVKASVYNLYRLFVDQAVDMATLKGMILRGMFINWYNPIICGKKDDSLVFIPISKTGYKGSKDPKKIVIANRISIEVVVNKIVTEMKESGMHFSPPQVKQLYK